MYLQIYFPKNVMKERIETEREKGTKEDENMRQVGRTLKPPPTPVPKISFKR